jgi:polyisoprenyl-teichoic acid--peptidoglycan teichoic acid transferase
MVRRRRKNTVPALLTGILVIIFLTIIGGIALSAMSWARGMLARPGIASGLPASSGPSENVKYEFGQIIPTWMGRQRVTVLLLGIDERAQESGPFRTDTIMLLTLDPTTKMAGILSIPRDLWVPIPGYNDGRINTAHFLGDLYKYAGGGPALARATVEYNLGVPIDYHVRVNFHAFVSMVDMIGGIDIYVEKDISDPLYPNYHYGYDPLHIPAGWHHFNGEMALKYARTRHGSSDFDRARRQQQVISAILEKVTNIGLLPDLAKKAPEIYEMLETSVQTDMALDQMLALANLATQIDRSTLRFGVIDQTCTQGWVTPDGAQVLIPLRDRMREVRDYVFAADVPTPALQEGNAQSGATPTPEVATLSVLNGTARAGLAGSTSAYLKTQGLDVTGVGNADRQDYGQTLVVLNRDKQLTATRVVALLNLPATAVVRGADPNAAHDIVVILGNDYAGPPPE